jgi:aspartyl-tRNA(Asn)/glutamyl-tRNA(Gln) amidotransferase subunit C
MKLNKVLLEKIAQNARLELSEKEMKNLLPELQEVLKMFSVLDEITVDQVKPSFQPIKVENVFREDKVEEGFTQEEVFLHVKNKEDGYFKGPKAV